MINYSLFGYALASSLILIFCWAIYRILFEAKVNPNVNRMVLLAVYAVTLLTPFVSTLIEFSSPAREIEIGRLSLAEIPDSTSEIAFHSSGTLPFMPILTKIYLVGLMVMLIITTISIYKLLKLKKRAGKLKINGLDVYIHDNKSLASFSWFNTIFLYKNAVSHDTQILLDHEKAHVNSYHWMDLLVAQIFLIWQWFNPVAWLMRKEIHQVHEYQADEKVLEKGYDDHTYQMLLLRNITLVRYPCFSDGFNNCSIKKRLIMMNHKKFKNNLGFRVIILIVAIISGGSLLHIPGVAAVMQTNPTEINKEEVTVSSQSGDQTEIKNDVGTIKNPSYEGGEVKLNRDLAMRTRYPYEAYKDNIQGTVIVQFTVTKTGGLKDFRIEKSVNTDLDIAAVNAIKDLPGRWTPGEIDGVKSDLGYSLPISFKIQ